MKLQNIVVLGAGHGDASVASKSLLFSELPHSKLEVRCKGTCHRDTSLLSVTVAQAYQLPVQKR